MPAARQQPCEASVVVPNLFMGSRVPPGRLRDVDLVVFCAEEYQPPAELFPGVTVLHAPLNDDGSPMTALEKLVSLRASSVVARALARGQKVLVTCWQGRNRSGLVTALALRRRGYPVDRAMGLVRRARGSYALSNQHFVRFLEGRP